MIKHVLIFLISSFLLLENIQGQEDLYDLGSNNEFFYYAEDQCFDGKNFYVGIESGVNFLQTVAIDGNESRYKTGYFIGGTLGYQYCYGFCLEAEYTYRRNNIKEIEFFTEGSSNRGHFHSSSFMVNVIWEIPSSWWHCEFWNIQPWFGAGIGYDRLHIHSSNSRIEFSQTWEKFAWQAMAGLSYPIFCNSEFTFEYKFHQGRTHFYNHSLGIGFIYKFMAF